MTDPVDVAKEALTKGLITNTTIKKEDWLSTGSTLLNLACSGLPYAGLAKGKYFWIVGDSSSGKTFLTLTALAEAAINKNFDEYDLIFNNAEDGALMEVRKYFGRLADRLKPPGFNTDGSPKYSKTIEEFYYHLDTRLTAVEKKKEPPFIELLDSMDALSSKHEGDKFQERKKAHEKNTTVTGDYGDGKAKVNSTWIRTVVGRLRDTGSILIILSQTRDDFDAGQFETDGTAAGGRALKFYASWQLWSSVGRILKTENEVGGKYLQTGIISKLKVKKNRLTGKQWQVEVPIYWSSGLDDVGSQIEYLTDNNRFQVESNGRRITIPDLNFEGPRKKIIPHIQDNNLEFDLQQMTAECWREMESACEVHRKNKYQ